MIWNLSIKGNYFYATQDATPFVVHEFFAKDVRIAKYSTISTSFRFTHLGRDIDQMGDLDISDIKAENGTDFTDIATFELWKNDNTGTNSKVEIAKNDLGYDAWGRPKTITDYSLFSSLWTYSVPNRVWVQYGDIGAGYIEQTQIDNNLVKSTHGHLLVTGNSVTDTYLKSKRHPRYQPNRGLLYSSSIFLPNPNYVGNRAFGLLHTENELCFRLFGDGTSWQMFIERHTTVGGVLTNQSVDITASILAKIPTFDPSKGNIYDLQMEWRGTGDFYIYVNLIKVYTFELQGTLDELSISNPALPVGFLCKGAVLGNDLVIKSGCVDVTSEGGSAQNKIYTSANTGKSLLPTNNSGKAILAVRVPDNVTYDGVTVPYTRYLLLTSLTTFCKDEAFISFIVARSIHVPNLDVLAGWNTHSDSYYQYFDNTDGTLDTAYQLDKANMETLFTTRQEKDISITHINEASNHSDFYVTSEDIILVELQSDGNSTGGVSLEFAEET